MLRRKLPKCLFFAVMVLPPTTIWHSMIYLKQINKIYNLFPLKRNIQLLLYTNSSIVVENLKMKKRYNNKCWTVSQRIKISMRIIGVAWGPNFLSVIKATSSIYKFSNTEIAWEHKHILYMWITVFRNLYFKILKRIWQSPLPWNQVPEDRFLHANL